MRELELVVSSGGERSYLVAARSAAGDTPDTPANFPFDERGLARRLQDVELALARSAAITRRAPGKDERPIQELGKELFAFLFPDRVRDHFSAERSQAARDDTAVQIRLRIRPPELAALPWELLYDSDRDDYLCLSMPVVRYPEVFEPVKPLTVTGAVRVLGMVARPGALSDLDVEREQRWLRDALASLAGTGQIELTWTSGQTWRDLQDGLDRVKPNVIHFIGHGGFDAARDEGVLALAHEDGRAHWMPASSLARLLAECGSLRLVVLNSCEGARASAGDVFSSTAAALTRRRIPAVVAMQYDISDQAAIAFARDFYRAIAAGHGVDQAVTRARRAIMFSRTDSLEWATPVLYLRSPNAHLFDLTQPPPPPPNPMVVPPADSPGTRIESVSPLVQIDVGSQIWVVAFSPDGTRLATASRDNTTRTWDTTTGRELTRMTHDATIWVAFSPDGTRLATRSTDRTARTWDTTTGRELTRMTHGDTVQAVAFSPDGTRLATASRDRTARTWDTTTGRELTRMTHDATVQAVAFSPNGAQIATISSTFWFIGLTAIRTWDTATGDEIADMTHDSVVWALAFSPDSTRLATASRDGTARTWHITTGSELTRMTHQGSVNAVTFSPDGTRLATASADNTARTWDTTTGRELTRMTHANPVRAVTFSPDGTRLATRAEQIILIWAV